MLDGWLLAPAAPEVVRERQAAVAELAPLLDLRDELTLRGRLIGATSDERRATSRDRHGHRAEADDDSSLVARRSSLHDLEPFLAWAEGEPWLARRRWLVWVARVSPALLWASVAAQVAGLLPLPLWPLLVAVNLVVSQTAGRAAYRVIATVAAYEGAFGHYAASFRLLTGASFEAPLLRRAQGELGAGGLAADAQLHRLHRLLTFQLPQGSLIHLPAQLAGLWDLHLLAALERWQAEAGTRARLAGRAGRG